MAENFTLDNELLEQAKSIATKIEDAKTRKRAYALNIAANAVAKQLNLRTSHSLYRIPAFAQSFELADLYIDGVRLDVRVSFNGKSFAIPKIQKKYEAEPHAYIVLQLEKDLVNAKILGFVPTEKLNQGKADDEYYLYSTSILSPIKNLKDFISTVELNQKIFSTNDHEKIKELATSFIDNEISESEKVYFIKHVINCPVCRETFCELNGFDLTALQVKNYHELLNDSTLSVLSGNSAEIAEAAIANLATVENAEENFENTIEEELETIEKVVETPITEETEELPLETSETIENESELLELNEDVELLEVIDETEPLETVEENEEIVLPMGVANAENTELEEVETLETVDSIEQSSEELELNEDVELLEILDEPEQLEIIETQEETTLPISAEETETTKEIVTEELPETLETVEEIITADDLPELMESEELLEILEENDSLIMEDETVEQETETTVEPLEEINDKPQVETLETIEDETILADELKLEEIEETEEVTESIEPLETVDDETKTVEEESDNELLIGDEELTPLVKMENIENTEEIVQEELEDSLEEIIEETEKEEVSEYVQDEDIIPVAEQQEIKEEEEEKIETEIAMTEEEIQNEDSSFEEASLDDLAALSDIADESEETETTESEEINQLLDDDLKAILSEEPNTEDKQETPVNVSAQQATTNINTLYETTQQTSEATNTEDGFVLPQEPVSDKTVNNAKKGLTMIALFILLASAGAAAWFVNNQRNSTDDIAMENANQDEMLNMQNQNMDAQPPAISQDINKSMTNSFSDRPTAITITKLSWQISEKLAMENSVKEYLQTAGKNIQMNLQNDLANSADINFNNSIKVSFEIAQDNTLKGLQILESSGSDQIDDIVARSIKNTLKYVSVPKIESHKSDYFLTLIINF